MRVLINAASANMGGAVTYLHNVLRWLHHQDPEATFIVYVPAETKAKLAAVAAPNVRLEVYPFSDTGGVARLYFDQVTIPRLVRQHRADVLFSTTGFGTFFSPCPQVLLVRNVAYFDRAFHDKYRQLGRSLRRNTVRRWHSLLSVRRADVVLFPSRAIRDLVGQYVSLGRKRTEVIPYGFDHERFLQNGHGTLEIAPDVQRWRSEGYHILLSVSTYAVQKNMETLIEALPHLAAAGLKVKLLTTTSRAQTTDTVEYDALKQRAQALGVDEAWVEVGYVPYQQLGALYQSADLYVFPSFTESFGHTLVEAMATGLPVIAAGTPVNQEVCGDAGAFFKTFDPTDCAKQIGEVVRDPAKARQLATASAARAKSFSWRRYAEALMTLFRSSASL